MNIVKKIAITIDDLPYVAFCAEEGVEITNMLLRHLRQNDVKTAGFVIGKIADESEKYGLLRKWQSDGHLLANHTYSHPSLSDISSDDFEKDVIRNEKTLKPFLENNPLKYFRFPYLDYGNTTEKRNTAINFLHKRSYTVVPVAVDTKDYIHNKFFTEAWLNYDAETMQYAIDKYLEYTKAVVEFCEQFVNERFRQIMLLHANRINAYCLDRVITFLKSRKYEFVSLSEVLNEPVYWHGNARINSPKHILKSGDGKSERIKYPKIDPVILEAYNRK